jgi:hypothetical protein
MEDLEHEVLQKVLQAQLVQEEGLVVLPVGFVLVLVHCPKACRT